jgi:exopolyphosphatase/guanosine-5'-triphosphate,3'-diphosphate pyrophosphatase
MSDRGPIKDNTTILDQSSKIGPHHTGNAVHEAVVIDVGSNSVRMVIYQIDGRAMTPIFNEKVMAGLGRNLAQTGLLSYEGEVIALDALRRFHALLQARGFDSLDVVATAAVRDAHNGPDFVARVAREAGFTIRVLPGVEEARLSAQGVLAGAPDADGVVGDMGGSSLELIKVTKGVIGAGETHPLGPLALMDSSVFSPERIQTIADAALSKSRVLSDHSGVFYAVGGAWRALGRHDIKRRHHPLGVLNFHEMTRRQVSVLIDVVSRQSRKSLEKSGEETTAKRADALPYAAIVLDRLLEIGKFQSVILSSYGLREGILFERFSQTMKAIHPLVAAAEAFGASSERAREFGRALTDWIEPVFESRTPAFGVARDRVLRAAACRLADYGGALHPDQRQENMFNLVLRAHFAAISHGERAFLATAMHHRYSRGAPDHEPAFHLLNEHQKKAAAALGAAMRLGAELSGRAPSLLQAFKLTMNNEKLVISGASEHKHLLTEPVLRRVEPLAEALNVPWDKTLV